MAYEVNKFNGTFLTSVADGTIDNTTDLRFIGKNYAGYGEIQNENFLHLLENFSNTTAPPKPVIGQIWYDSTLKKLKFYDGSKFKIASGAEVSTSAPTGLAAGDFWFDETAQQLYTWTGQEFVLIGPAAAPEFGNSSAVGSVVQDTNGSAHSIIKMIAADVVVAIINSDAEFELGSSFRIPGFDIIKRGVTLVNTLSGSNGVTSTATGFLYWGTASNALKLGGQDASNYLTRDNTAFTGSVTFPDAGFRLGQDLDLHIFVETRDPNQVDLLRDEDQLVVSQTSRDQPITFRVQVNDTTKINVAKIKTTGINPGVGSFFTLGSSTFKWLNVFADTFTGDVAATNIAATNITISNALGGLKGNLKANDDTIAFDKSSKTFFGTLGTTSNRSLVYGDIIGDVTGSATTASRLGSYAPSIVSGAETVAVRDSSGAITAASFIGTASKADRLKIDNTATDTDPNYKSAKTTATGSTIVARTADADIFARIFDGTATAARYADLAEKYLADKEYDVGTVVSVCEHGEHEVEASSWGQRAIGVVSANPAFMMNSELEGGTYIALKGRVPVKVIGAVKKGQRLIAGNDGCAVAAVPHANDVFAIALESSAETGTKLIEAIVL
jgi:hypothetical protein